MSLRLATLSRGKGPLPPTRLVQIQKWIDEDWESHDIDRDAVRLIQRLLLTIKSTNRHAIDALREMAKRKCDKKNCGTVCLCGPCHARAALLILDPEWRP